MKTLICVAIAAAAAAGAAPAFADCEMRPMSAAEAKFNASTTEALTAALPAAPQGWSLVVNKTDGANDVCAEDAQGRFEIVVRADYRYQPSKEEAASVAADRKALQKRIEDLGVLPPGIVKERQVWLDKMSAANKAENAAEKAGDKAAASKAGRESEEYSRKGREVRERYRASVRPQVTALEGRIKALNEGLASVGAMIAANELFVSAPDAATGTEMRAGKLPAPRTGGLKVHGVRLVLEGPAARRAIIAAAADQKKLDALVK